MKKIIPLLFSILLLVSCSEDDNSNEQNVPSGKMTFELKGENVTIEEFTEVDLLNHNREPIGKTIYGYNTYNESRNIKRYQVYLYLEGPDNTGEYNLLGIDAYVPDANSGVSSASSTMYSNWIANKPGLPLEHNFQFPNNSIKGTFSAELASSIHSVFITNGVIDYEFNNKNGGAK